MNDDVGAMHVVEGEENLLNDRSCFELTERLPLNYLLIEHTSLDQLCYTVIAIYILKEFEDVHNMWMSCVFQILKLVLLQLHNYIMLFYSLLTDNLAYY